MPKIEVNNKDQKINVLTPEEIANQELEKKKRDDQAKKELEERLDKESKIQDFKNMYYSIKDPYYAMAKINDGKTNPADYLKEAIETMDDSKLKSLKKAFDDDKDKLDDDYKQNQIEELLSQIPYSMLDNDLLKNQKVLNYIDKKKQLITKLKSKLGI